MSTTRCGIYSFRDRKSYCPFTPKTFTTNAPSHPSEALTLRQSLSKIRGELEQVNAELELAEAAVIRMKAMHSRILSSLHNHGKLLRPILFVPDDILQLIFEWTIPSPSDKEDTPMDDIAHL